MEDNREIIENRDNKKNKNSKKKEKGFRIDIVLVVCFFVLLISFCAYMMNTTLEDVVKAETGKPVITHDYTYESSSEE